MAFPIGFISFKFIIASRREGFRKSMYSTPTQYWKVHRFSLQIILKLYRSLRN
jgi:hypothetical protein